MDMDTILAGISQKAAGMDPINASLKISLGEQVIYLDGKGDSNVVSSEDKDADCTITISENDFKGIISGSINPMMAFMSGKIKVAGDMSLAMKLQSLL